MRPNAGPPFGNRGVEVVIIKISEANAEAAKALNGTKLLNRGQMTLW